MFRNISNKIRYKIFGYAKIKAQGKRRGYALLSYITMPFTILPWQMNTDPHSNYWEAKEIAKILSLNGFEVHIIDWKDNTFLPKKKYSLVVDINKNLQRLHGFLPNDCKKIMHIVSASPEFQNQAEKNRLKYLEKRTGIKISAKRFEEDNKNASYADYIEGFGNKTTRSSYNYANKEIFDIPISVSQTFDFINRNIEITKKKFIWFGGGGPILKGLDLVLEIFKELPQLELAVVGPIKADKEFYRHFQKYFELPNITIYDRPKFRKNGQIYIGDESFKDFLSKYSFLIYPSASEGTSGSVIQAMHSGIIPVITKETGLKEDSPSIILDEINITYIKDKIKELSNMSNEEIKKMSDQVLLYAKSRHTKESFSYAYNKFIEKILNE